MRQIAIWFSKYLMRIPFLETIVGLSLYVLLQVWITSSSSRILASHGWMRFHEIEIRSDSSSSSPSVEYDFIKSPEINLSKIEGSSSPHFSSAAVNQTFSSSTRNGFTSKQARYLIWISTGRPASVLCCRVESQTDVHRTLKRENSISMPRSSFRWQAVASTV